MSEHDDLQYLAPVFSVAQPKMKPVTAIAFAIVMCLLAVSTQVFRLERKSRSIYSPSAFVKPSR